MLTTEKRAALQKPFDIRPCHGCTLDDLVLDLFSVGYLPAAVDRDVIAENQRDIPEQMASLRLYDLAADCPTNAAALLFAKDPLRCIRAQEALRRNGNPEATFTFDPSHVLATIESKP